MNIQQEHETHSTLWKKTKNSPNQQSPQRSKFKTKSLLILFPTIVIPCPHVAYEIYTADVLCMCLLHSMKVILSHACFKYLILSTINLKHK